jgi:hypothetical protein
MPHGRWKRVGFLVAMTGLTTVSACSNQTPPDPMPAPADFSSRQTRVPAEYLVTLAAGADVKAIADAYGRFGIRGTRSLGRNVFLVTLTEDPGPAKMDELREQNVRIKAVQPNFVYHGRGNIPVDESGASTGY